MDTIVWVCAPLMAMIVSCGLTYVARAVAMRWGIVDKPDGGRKRHASVTPLLGGVAVFVSVLGVVAATWLIVPSAASRQDWLVPMLASASLYCLLGVYDDCRPLRAREKLLLQIVASLPFALWGPRISSVYLLGFAFDLGSLSIPFTIFWLVACANVINLVDGLDGLASSLGLVVAATLATVSAIVGNADVSLLSLIFAGSLAGFLFHNWPPAKIFLGDAGSLTIGFMIGALSVEASLKTTAGFVLMFPLVMLSVPILDTSMAILRRRLMGRAIGEADRGHIHHKLLDRGLTKLQTLLAISGLSVAMAVASLTARFLASDYIAAISCLLLISLIVASRIFGFREFSLVFRHLGILHKLLGDAAIALRPHVARVRMESSESPTQTELWQAVCKEVEARGGTVLTCHFDDEWNGRRLVTQWQTEAAHEEVERNSTWNVDYSILRDDGLRVSLNSTGFAARAGGLGHLFPLFETFCRQCPADESIVSPDAIVPHVLQIQRAPSATDSPLEERRAA